MIGLTEKALRNFNLWVGKKRIGANIFRTEIKLNLLHRGFIRLLSLLTYSLGRAGKILAFSVPAHRCTGPCDGRQAALIFLLLFHQGKSDKSKL